MAEEKDQSKGGPSSPEGRERSSRNATKHGAFANYLLATESKDEFDQLHNGYIVEHMPEGETETSLCFNLAQIEWRRRRFVVYETKVMDKAIENLDSKAIGHCGTYMQRIQREFQSVLKTLKEHQAPRWKDNGMYYGMAVHFLDYCQRNEIAWQPSEEGFVFSKETLEKQLKFNQDWGRVGKQIKFYPTTKEADERWSKNWAKAVFQDLKVA